MPLVLNKDTFKKIKEDNIKLEKIVIEDKILDSNGKLLDLDIINDTNGINTFFSSDLGFYFTAELPITYTISL